MVFRMAEDRRQLETPGRSHLAVRRARRQRLVNRGCLRVRADGTDPRHLDKIPPKPTETGRPAILQCPDVATPPTTTPPRPDPTIGGGPLRRHQRRGGSSSGSSSGQAARQGGRDWGGASGASLPPPGSVRPRQGPGAIRAAAVPGQDQSAGPSARLGGRRGLGYRVHTRTAGANTRTPSGGQHGAPSTTTRPHSRAARQGAVRRPQVARAAATSAPTSRRPRRGSSASSRRRKIPARKRSSSRLSRCSFGTATRQRSPSRRRHLRSSGFWTACTASVSGLRSARRIAAHCFHWCEIGKRSVGGPFADCRDYRPFSGFH